VLGAPELALDARSRDFKRVGTGHGIDLVEFTRDLSSSQRQQFRIDAVVFVDGDSNAPSPVVEVKEHKLEIFDDRCDNRAYSIFDTHRAPLGRYVGLVCSRE